MAPVILARAGVDFALKVHGSDLSYTVLPNLERFEPYALEGLEAAAGILVGSGHIAERLRQAVDRRDVNAKVRLGPPGVDTDLFVPIAPAEAPDRLHALAKRLAADAALPQEGAGRELLGPRPRRGGGGGRVVRRGRGPAGRLRRQADRLEGRRPAARGVAPRARGESRSAPA